MEKEKESKFKQFIDIIEKKKNQKTLTINLAI